MIKELSTREELISSLAVIHNSFKGTSINYISDVPLWAQPLDKSGFIIFQLMKKPDF